LEKLNTISGIGEAVSSLVFLINCTLKCRRAVTGWVKIFKDQTPRLVTRAFQSTSVQELNISLDIPDIFLS